MPPINPNSTKAQRPPARRRLVVTLPKRSLPAGPRGDIGTGGPNYGSDQANQFKQSRAYRGASRAGYTAGTKATKRAVLVNPHPSVERTVARTSHAHRERGNQAALVRLSKSITAPETPAGDIQPLTTKQLLELGNGSARPHQALSPAELRADLEALGLAPKPRSAGGSSGGLPLASASTAAALSEGAGKVGKTIAPYVVNAGKDVIDIPAETPTSLYKIGRDTVTKGPLAGAKDLAEPYVQLVEHPLRSLKAHPVGTALLVTGPARSLDQAAGAVGRVAGVRAVSRVREPATVPGTELRVPRSYSKGIAAKGVQVVLERRKTSKAADLERRAAEAQAAGKSKQAAELQAKSVRANPTVLKPSEQHRLASGLEGMNVAVQRAEKAATAAPISKALRGRTEATSLIAQAVAKPTRESIREYVDMLDHERQLGDLTQGDRIANEATASKLRLLLASRRFDVDKEAQAAEAVRDDLVRLDEGLAKRGILPREQAQRAALIPHAVVRQGAEVTAEEGLSRAGRTLSNDEVTQAMGREGYLDPPAFVSHRPNTAGRAGRYASAYPMRTLLSKRRTGEAIRAGTTDLSPAAIVAHAQRRQALLSAHDGFRRIVQVAGYRAERGGPPKVLPAASAAKYAETLSARTGVPWVPVSIHPFGARTAEIRDVLEGPDAHATEGLGDAVRSALKGTGPGQKVLLPKAVVDELNDHLKILDNGPLAKSFRTYTQAFKRVVLATSPKWLAGNAVEGSLRAAVKGAGPQHAVFAARVLRDIAEQDEQVARALGSQVIPGGHYGAAQRTYIQPGDFAKRIGRFPVAKQAAAVWNTYTGIVFNQINSRIEDTLQLAIAGKVMKAQLGSAGLATHGAKAVEQAVQHYQGTSEQLALGRDVHRAFGQYESFGPKLREAVVRYTPFLPWFVNAVKFLYVVLPKDHPLLTAVVADAHLASEDWRKTHGFDLWSSGARPAFLQGGIPGAGSSTLRIAHYTPFGAIAEGVGSVIQSRPGGLADYLLPQASDPLNALQGKDFAGRTTKDPFVRWSQAFTGILPLASAAINIRSGKGPVLRRVRKQYDPFAFTKGKAKSGPATSGGRSLPKLQPLPSLPKLPSLSTTGG